MTDPYASAEESAAVMRPATENEKWLYAQLHRIDPHRHEMGSAGDTPALVKLVFELRDRLESQPAQQQQEPVPPSDDNIFDAWVSACDSEGVAYDGPSFERGYRLGRGECDEYTGALAAQHPDDVAVDCFAQAMKAKMAKQRAKGYGDWDDPAACPTERLQKMLLDHIPKGDPVDVGNFAMMLHCRGDATANLERNPS